MSRQLPSSPVGPPPGANPFIELSLDQLRERRSLKWRGFPADVLPLWVAEMDVRIAPAVVEAVSRALADGDTGYPQGTDYAEAWAAFAGDRWAWTVDPADVRLAGDVMTGIAEVLELVTEPGDAVVVTPPVYPPFFACVAHRGRELVTAPLGPEDRLDLAALEQAFTTATAGGRGAALLLANPHNPTGTVPTAAELRAVAALAERFGVRVLVDEIHAPLTFDGPFTPYLTVPGGERGFSVTSASKGWNLAGLKAALVIPGAAATGDLARMAAEVSHAASALGVLAHAVALRSGLDWLEDCRAGLDANRRLLSDLVDEHLPDVGYRMPAATYLAWLDCRALGLGDDPAAVFLDRGRVAVNPGPSFGAGGAGHVRLNFATAPAILTEAVERMAASL